MPELVDPGARRRKLSERTTALESQLPPFPELAWRGIFDQYRDLMSNDPREPGTPISECPMPFHFANLLAICAAEMGHGLQLREGSETFGNLFILCVGRTGTKKSTASSLARRYIAKRFPGPALHHRISSVSSGEALIRTLCQYSNLFLCYDEMKDLFSTAARAGSKLETDINKSFNLETLANNVKREQESNTADEYYFNILGNCTPDHLLLDMSETMFKGGTLNRFLVFAAKPTDIIKPCMGIPDQKLGDAIAAQIWNKAQAWLQVAPSRGQIFVDYEPEALELQKEWYTKNTVEMKSLPDLDASPIVRLDTFSKKIAMVYMFYETDPTPTPRITAGQMEAAIAATNYSRRCMQWSTDAWAGQRATWQQAEKLAEDRVLSFLTRKGCMSEQILYRQMRTSFSETKKAVDAQVAAGQLAVSGATPRMVHAIGICTCDV